MIVSSFAFGSIDVVQIFNGVNERSQAVPCVECVGVSVERILAAYVFTSVV